MKVSEKIKKRILAAGDSFWAGDNISKHIEPGERTHLIDEVAERFTEVLDALVIDTKNDPNSRDTGARLAKMYVNEIMAGRYHLPPNVTSFPNTGKNSYHGMITARAEFTSLCSHHHQTVKGVAYIGVIPTEKVIGLSKYTRIVQWCARRGTLQEELTNDICREIMKATESENVAVYTQATHGCMENRGVESHSSLTQTTVVKGLFNTSHAKTEFFDNIKLQQNFAC